MDHSIDPRLHDHVALAEIELYTELLTAVATAECSLTLDEIDRVLGVRPVREPDPPPMPSFCTPRRSRVPRRSRR
ncbi:hypothetical protein [Allosalinactinospora lopnorensis]|uniref:hypothetical protein n=1 Tax=Allosalinactinospora lopnorensis TaxID=1352348 RepID=UPI000623E7D9|nr:hypothetical protein [Allosalinactinospora lopnorensis]